MSSFLNPLKLLELGESTDADEFIKRLLVVTLDLGFPLVSGVVMSGTYADPNPSIKSFGNLPAGYEAIATDMEEARRDPVLAALAVRARPFVYRQQTYVDAGMGEAWEEQAAFGYANGIAVRLQVDAKRTLIVGVDGFDPLPGDQDEKLFSLMTGLQLIATNAAAAADQIFKLPDANAQIPALTPKELEVMKWTLHGKTAWEVGMIMSLSENTVRFHTTNATRKLGVSSKHQAALKCKIAGLIS